MNELALFAGAGGGILGGLLHGWRTVAAVEIEDYPRRVLLQRQADGILPRFPIWDDVRTFDGKPWRGKVDVISGGFPCQDISSAGKGAGIEGERSGLWGEFSRIIGEVEPRFVYVENSPMLLTARKVAGWLVTVVHLLFGRVRFRDSVTLYQRPDVLRVLGDLSQMGYNARWGVLGAHHVGAPHKRDRIWIKAELCNANGYCEPVGPVNAKASGVCKDVADANSRRSNEDRRTSELRSGRTEQSPAHSRTPGAGTVTERQGGIRWWDQDPADVADAERGGCGQDREQRGVATMGERGENDAVQAEEPDMGKPDAAEVVDSDAIGRDGRAGEQRTRGRRESANTDGRPAQSFVGRDSNGVAEGLDLP